MDDRIWFVLGQQGGDKAPVVDIGLDVLVAWVIPDALDTSRVSRISAFIKINHPIGRLLDQVPDETRADKAQAAGNQNRSLWRGCAVHKKARFNNASVIQTDRHEATASYGGLPPRRGPLKSPALADQIVDTTPGMVALGEHRLALVDWPGNAENRVIPL